MLDLPNTDLRKHKFPLGSLAENRAPYILYGELLVLFEAFHGKEYPSRRNIEFASRLQIWRQHNSKLTFTTFQGDYIES